MYRHFSAMWLGWQKDRYLLWGKSPLAFGFCIWYPAVFQLGLVWLTAGGGTEAAIITLACSELQSPANWLISAL